jgi:methylenetetrahydrofolate dehydrogenase (NADP+)/methenyltetrahydrofolate cyclohydrolase
MTGGQGEWWLDGGGAIHIPAVSEFSASRPRTRPLALPMALLSGRIVADEVLGRLALRTAALARAGLRAPQLVIVECGHDPRSAVYIRNKVRTADRAGVRVRVDSVEPGPAAQQELLGLIAALNVDEAVHGVIVQMPLPPGVEASLVLRAVDAGKDVDGLAPVNTGELEGATSLGEVFVPATALGILLLLRWVEREHEGGFTLRGKHCVVVGKGALAGGPVTRLLGSEALAGCTVSACDVDTPTPVLRSLLGMADIVVTATGRALIQDPSWLRVGAVVIDAGIRVEEVPAEGDKPARSAVLGDVDWRTVLPRCSYITPVPGGVGLMTVAALLVQVVQAAEQQQALMVAEAISAIAAEDEMQILAEPFMALGAEPVIGEASAGAVAAAEGAAGRTRL